MLNIEEIRKYHHSGFGNIQTGFELEFFVFNIKDERIFYNKNSDNEIKKIFNFLCKKKNFKPIKSNSTYGVEKDGKKFTLEPGSQIEYSSAPSEDIKVSIDQIEELYRSLDEIENEFNLIFKHKAYIELIDKNKYKEILPKERYKIMYDYFMKYNKYGREMMFNTSSLQFSFSYTDLESTKIIVKNLLMLKPLLLRLSSNSKIKKGIYSNYYSYREYVWSKMDQRRCGEPGSDVWKDNEWNIDKYINKTLKAPRIFFIKDNKYYPTTDPKAFIDDIKKLNIKDYLLHNSSVFYDVRIKNYIELRFLDNPGHNNVFGIIILLNFLINDLDYTKKLANDLPYKLEDVPKITKILNVKTKESEKLWENVYKPIVNRIVEDAKAFYSEDKIDIYLKQLSKKKN